MTDLPIVPITRICVAAGGDRVVLCDGVAR